MNESLSIQPDDPRSGSASAQMLKEEAALYADMGPDQLDTFQPDYRCLDVVIPSTLPLPSSHHFLK